MARCTGGDDRAAKRMRRELARVARAAADVTAASVQLRSRQQMALRELAKQEREQPPPQSEAEAMERLVAKIDAELGEEQEPELDVLEYQ